MDITEEDEVTISACKQYHQHDNLFQCTRVACSSSLSPNEKNVFLLFELLSPKNALSTHAY